MHGVGPYAVPGITPATPCGSDMIWCLLQPLLLVMALAAVPVMLLVKPLILKKRHEARHTIAVRIYLLATPRCCLFLA